MNRAAMLLLGLFCAASPADSKVSFQHDVMAILSRAGCNSGACHGNLNGKGGFKLSLRGENPQADYLALTRDMLGRRLNFHRPEQSLLLAKATMTTAHEGGQRFAPTSSEAALLRRWIAAGAPNDPPSLPRPVQLHVTPTSAILSDPTAQVQLRVQARFSDGRERDVTALACFEPSGLAVRIDATATVHRVDYGETSILVRYLDQQAVVRLAFIPQRVDYVWKEVPEVNFIDRHVFARLRALRLYPADVCSDEEFIRRSTLDTIGLLPTPKEVRDFLADPSPDKRTKWIEKLVGRSEFADFWALKWSDLLRNEEKVLDTRGVQVFHDWIRRAIHEDRPLNEFARELIASRGSTYAQPAANYYRALRDPYSRAEATAQVFLGLRLQCAKCHNHPFDRWTQSDYHQFAAFFARVDYRIVENNRRDKLDSHEFVGEQIVFLKREGELKHPVTGKNLVPKFLGEDSARIDDNTDRLSLLADWVARSDNPFFARTQANRVWQHLVGRGIVDPGDDFRDSNPPSNPELLDALQREFVANGFRLKHLVKTILRSRTYQLASRSANPGRDDEPQFARAIVRPLQAEQLLDAIAQVVGSAPRFQGFPAGTRAGQLPGVGAQRRRGQGAGDAEKFLAVFGKPVRSLSCECERSEETTLARAFQLITGPLLHRLLAREDNRLGKLLAENRSNDEILDELYLAALSRLPTERERRGAADLLARAEDRRAAWEDVLWALLNSKEFLLRR